MSSAEDPDGGISRAEAALDRLVREPSAPWWTRLRATHRRPLAMVSLIVAAALVAGAVLTQRRPPPIDDRLPVADAAAAPAAPSTVSSAAADPAVASGVSSTVPGAHDAAAAPTTRVVVHVAGAVSRPGVIDLASGSRVVDAVQAAGGLRADADADRVNLAAPLVDGQLVSIPILGQAPVAPVAPVPGPGSGTGSGPAGVGGASGGAAVAVVDLNTADAAALDELPGVGPSTAAAIIAHREKEGAFSSVDGLLDVRGIGEAKLEAMRDLVTVGG